MERTAKIIFVILPITITITIISAILTVHLIPDSWHDSPTAIVLQPIIELGLEKQFLTLVHGVVWIGIATVLGATSIWSIRRIGRMIGLPVDDMFDEVKKILNGKLGTMKNGKGTQEPFRFSMLGIKIEARGFIGRIMFIALLGTIATTAGTGFDYIWQFDAVPDGLYDSMNMTNTPDD